MLPHYLQALQHLRYPGETHYVFYEDASTDTSREILQAFAATVPHVTLLLNDTPFTECTSSRDARDRKALYGHLADVRNHLLDVATAQQPDAVLCIDSDSLAHPQLVEQLARHQTSYCASLINNRKTIAPADLTLAEWRDPCNLMAGPPDALRHVRPVPLRTLIRGNLSGAVMLLRGEALQARFAYHPLGEDGGHCAQLAARGLPIYCDTTPLAVHVLKPQDLALARQTAAVLSTR